MKKLFVFLSILVLLFVSFPISVSAESFTISQETIEMFTQGIDDLSYTSGVPYGFLPWDVFGSAPLENDLGYKDVLSLEIGEDKQDLFNISSDDFQIRRLNTDEKNTISEYSFYDSEGNGVLLDNILFGYFDNGYFTGYFYTDAGGNPLYLDSSKSSTAASICFGGSNTSQLQWQLAYDSLSDSLESNGYNYSLTGSTVNTGYAYYQAYGETSSGRPARAFSMFIPNQYQPGIIVPYITRSDRYICNWYCNDLSVYDYRILYGNETRLTVTQGNYSYNGYTYRYNVSMGQGSTSFVVNNTFENWVRGVNVYDNHFGASGIWLNNSLLNSDVVSFKKVGTSANTIDFSKAYSLDELSDYYSDAISTSALPNSAFNSSSAITSLNYPLVWEVDDAIAETDIAFPESMVGVYDPAIDYPLNDTLDPTLISNNIPIISDLQNKFPFSIPWDIYSLFKGLEAERETPYINTTVVIPGINYSWHIEYDLSAFDDTAALFRTLFLISFIVGLGFFSYEHFFGS